MSGGREPQNLIDFAMKLSVECNEAAYMATHIAEKNAGVEIQPDHVTAKIITICRHLKNFGAAVNQEAVKEERALDKVVDSVSFLMMQYVSALIQTLQDSQVAQKMIPPLQQFAEVAFKGSQNPLLATIREMVNVTYTTLDSVGINQGAFDEAQEKALLKSLENLMEEIPPTLSPRLEAEEIALHRFLEKLGPQIDLIHERGAMESLDQLNFVLAEYEVAAQRAIANQHTLPSEIGPRQPQGSRAQGDLPRRVFSKSLSVGGARRAEASPGPDLDSAELAT